MTGQWLGKLQPVDFRFGQGEGASGRGTKLLKN